MTSGRGMSRANENRAIRQQALREQLEKQGHLQKVIDDIEEMRELASSIDQAGGDSEDQSSLPALTLRMNVLDKAISQRMKLVDKYIPGLKSVEVTGDGGGPVQLSDGERMARLAAIADAARARAGGSAADGGAAVDAPEGSSD